MIGATQAALVDTFVDPMNVVPSPLPNGSHVRLAKNSMRKFETAVLLRVPWIVVDPAIVVAEVSTGKF